MCRLLRFALLPALVAGCGWAGLHAGGGRLPAGHPKIDAGPAPDAVVPDAAGGRFEIPGGGITRPIPQFKNATTADLIGQMAELQGQALCYWSWQSLPPPADPVHNPNWGQRGAFDFAAMETLHPGSVVAIRDLCTYAVDRLQDKVGPTRSSGINVLAAVTEGTEFGRYLCQQGLHLDKAAHPERCAPLHNQSWALRWPTSVTMWRFDGNNTDQVTSVMKAWRAEPTGHLPNILSPGPSPPPAAPVAIPPPKPRDPVPADGGEWPHAGTGWGPGGAVVGKALPCDNIPAQFKYKTAFAQDTSPAGYVSPNGKTFLEDALDYWTNTPGVSICLAVASRLCLEARGTGKAACGVCALEHATALAQAGCSASDLAGFCGGSES